MGHTSASVKRINGTPMPIPVLRPFQALLKSEVIAAWQKGARNVIMQLATGGGKTVLLSDLVRDNIGYSCVIAHRSELVSQLSLTLARYSVRHNIIASEATRKNINRMHVEELGYSLVDPNAYCIVASVDTLVRQDASVWAGKITLWVVDEGHHLVLDNKWHKAISAFTHEGVRGLLPTATPCRADGKGLGRVGGSGIADALVCGPPMRWLIERGYLCDYRIIAPASDLEVFADVGASGDWSVQALREASKRSHIVGDVVMAYQRWGEGKLGITFATDVETADAMTRAYSDASIPAACLTGKTDAFSRRALLRRFADRQIKMIVAVDIISEGFDLPAIEYLGMARPTQSYAVYAQQFGRALRPLPGKKKAIIIDHAGNVVRHQGPPDRPRPWSLLNRDKRGKNPTGIPHRVCDQCLAPYERYHRDCPFCGRYMPPGSRSSPPHVDGDLAELDDATLQRLRGLAEDADLAPAEWAKRHGLEKWDRVVANAQMKNHGYRLDAQQKLRVAMASWGARHRATGFNDAQMQRLFFLTFGISTLEAMALHAREAGVLTERLADAI